MPRTIRQIRMPLPGATALVTLPAGWRALEGLISARSRYQQEIMLVVDIHTENPPVTEMFLTVGVNWVVPENAEHVCSVVDSGGYVWVVYLLPRLEPPIPQVAGD